MSDRIDRKCVVWAMYLNIMGGEMLVKRLESLKSENNS